jgi:conserved oligomeric Golgi complex subunit 3
MGLIHINMFEQPKQREASTYGAKYRLLLTRALTLIRNYFTSSLRDISADVTKRMADRQLNDSTISALLYAKFRVGAPELKKLGQEIQKRAAAPEGAAPGTEGEYQGLLNELHQSYSTTRARLLQPIVSKRMTELSSTPSTSGDLVQFARSGVNFIRGLCSDEYDLWGEWFTDDQMLYPFLDSLCEPFYDRLRPKIIHETKIIKLCEFCTLIQTRYLEDSDLESEDSDGQSFDFGRLIQPALQDAQDRLVFLAQVILRNDIQYFKPKPEHLDYPRRASRVALSGSRNQPPLSGRKGSNGPLSPIPKNPIIVEEDGIDREPVFDSGTGEYYPTLRRAVWLLSRIYRLIHVSLHIFDLLSYHSRNRRSPQSSTPWHTR